jgi:8-oxo-dGTP diphosphatase
VPRAAELTPPAAIDVIVGVIVDQYRRVLIAQRPRGKHMGGAWEFPGGKLEPSEDAFAGLVRELEEEIGIIVEAAERFFEQRFDYPDRAVRLDVWWVSAYRGVVRPAEGQPLEWVAAEALSDLPILPADRPIVAAIQSRLAGAGAQPASAERQRIR